MTLKQILKKHKWSFYKLTKHMGDVPTTSTHAWKLKVRGERKVTDEEATKLCDLVKQLEGIEITKAELMDSILYRLKV